MAEKPLSGWMGEERELLHTLETFGADKGEDGRFLIYEEPIVKGMDGSIAVHQNCMCKIGGKPARVAHLMQQTSYGTSVVVI